MKAIVWIVAVVALAAGAYWFIEERNEGPLEKAAEDIEDAADEVADDLDDANN